MFANWSCLIFSYFSFGSYLFLLLAIIDSSRTFFAGNATLVYHLLSKSVLWCYQQLLTIFQLWWRSTFDGLQLLVELSFWWSSSSHSFGFAQWWRFLFSYYCCCAHLSAVVERCLWHRLVHTATQLNRLSTDLLATGTGFDPRWRPSWSVFYFFYHQRRRSCGSLFWLVVGTSMRAPVVRKHKEVRTTVVTYSFHVVVGSSASWLPSFLSTNSL